jgi:hypothetical protein
VEGLTDFTTLQVDDQRLFKQPSFTALVRLQCAKRFGAQVPHRALAVVGWRIEG